MLHFMIGHQCKTGHAGNSQHCDERYPEENNSNRREEKSETKSNLKDFLEQMHFSLRQNNILLTGEQ